MKASSYFLAGGDSEDLIQEGLIGLYKAVRDFSPELSSFRSFAELCVTRQIITAIKTATRFKHSPLNSYVSVSDTPAGQESEGDSPSATRYPGRPWTTRRCARSRPRSCRTSLHARQPPLQPRPTPNLYLEGESYEDMAERLGCDTKTIDNALQRVKRKVLAHQQSRQVLQ